MAEKRTINIDIKNNADKTAKDFDTLNKSIDNTTKSTKNLNSTFEEVYGELQPLTTRMGEAEDRLYELALAGDTASKEYQELLTKVGEYRKVQIQTDLAVDGAATTIGQKLGSALNGATSGFAATQGAMALFGTENDALEKSLLKVQSALAIQQGVEGLRTSYKELGGKTGIATKAQAAFNFVMNLNPIMLIVTGLTLAIAALLKFTSVLDPVIQGLKDFGDAIGLTNFAEDKRAEEQKKRHEEFKKQQEERINLYETEINVLKFRDEKIQKSYDTEIKLRKAAGKDFADIEKAKLQTTVKTETEILKQRIEKLNEFKKQGKTLMVAIATEQAKAQLDVVKNAQADLKILENENLKERLDNYKNYAAERLSIARQIEDIENSLLTDGIEKELEINRDKFRRLREDAKKNTKLTRTERAALKDLYDKQELAQQKVINKKYVDLEKEKNKKIDEEKAKANQERIDKEDALFLLQLEADNDKQGIEIANLQKAFEAKYALAVGNAELMSDLMELQETEEAKIRDKFRKEKADKEKAASDKSIAEAQAEADAKLAIQNAQIGIAEAGIGLIKELAGENKKILAAALIAENAAGVAKIIINTVAANAKAVVASPLTAGQPWVSINSIGAGIGIASSVAATAKGLSALGGGGSPDSGSVPSGGAASAAAPQFNVVGDSGINQIAQLQQQPVQAFVVSGEVTTSQALDRNRVQNATL